MKPAPGDARPTIQVIARAASVLRALEGEDHGLSLAQIARRVGLARSTVQRIVESLSAEQFLIAAGPSAKVRIGPALVRIASSATLEIAELVRPLLVELCQSIGETVDLSVLKRGAAVFIDQIPGSHRLRAVSAVGEVFPLHCTANGKALLSMLAEEKVERLFRTPLPEQTPNSLTKPRDVLAAVAACRLAGFALDEEEHTEGISAVGTAFLDPLGRPYAISIPMPTGRFQRRRDQAIEQLLEVRERIRRLLGTDRGSPQTLWG